MTAITPTPGIPITRYGDAWEILNSRAFEPHRPESHPLIGGSLLLLDGDVHFQRRKFEGQLFTSSALRYYEAHALGPLIAKTIDTCLLGVEPGEEAHVDLVPVALDMLYELSATILGIDNVGTTERIDHFKKLFERISDGATVDWSTRDHAEVVADALDARQEFQSTFYTESRTRREQLVARHRRGELELADLPRDLLTLLLMNDINADDDDLPLREVILFLLASIRTTLNAVPHVVAHLADWSEEHPQEIGLLADNQFLRDAVAETVRLHAALPAVIRRAKTDVTLGSGQQLQTGQLVSILLDQVNTDEELYGPTAGTFDPRRAGGLKGPNGKGQLPRWGMAFGSGAHVCIGRRIVVGDEETRMRGDSQVHGTAVTILRALYQRGLRRDPERAPRLESGSYYDTYESFPILLGGTTHG